MFSVFASANPRSRASDRAVVCKVFGNAASGVANACRCGRSAAARWIRSTPWPGRNVAKGEEIRERGSRSMESKNTGKNTGKNAGKTREKTRAQCR
jgi:threonine dehydratase